MATWNYRVCKEGDTFVIKEVYYSEDDGLKMGQAESPAAVLVDVDEGVDALSDVLDRMREALSKPIIVDDTGDAKPYVYPIEQ